MAMVREWNPKWRADSQNPLGAATSPTISPSDEPGWVIVTYPDGSKMRARPFTPCSDPTKPCPSTPATPTSPAGPTTPTAPTPSDASPETSSTPLYVGLALVAVLGLVFIPRLMK